MMGKDAGEIQGLWEGRSGGKRVYGWGGAWKTSWRFPTLNPAAVRRGMEWPLQSRSPPPGWLPSASHSLSHHVQTGFPHAPEAS